MTVATPSSEEDYEGGGVRAATTVMAMASEAGNCVKQGGGN